jgi:hypothetical protein
VLALWFVMPPAYAWHRAGHNMTAGIAFGLLNEQQQQHAAAILNAHPRFKQDFAAAMPQEIANGSEREKNLWMFKRASIWPDIVRNVSKAVRTQYHRSTWHYINLPVYLTDKDEKELAGKLDANVQMQFDPPLRQNLNMVQALKGNLLVWRDETAADADRAVAFCWVLHLTGDMHQPLHNVALFSRAWFPHGDYGGASIKIRRGDDVTNLHVVWDGLPNRFDDLSPDENTKALPSKDAAKIQSIDTWANQSHRMAMEYAYTDEVKRKLLHQVSNNQNPEISLTAEYIDNASQVARPQIIIAGHRIAALITN